MRSRTLLQAAYGLLWIGLFVAAVLLGGHEVCGSEPIYLPPAPDALPVPELAGPPPLATPIIDGYGPGVPVADEGGGYSPGVRYWIVSSRNSPQEVSRIHCGHLCVYERRCDGSLCPSSLSNLQAQLQPNAPVLLSIHGSYLSWDDNLSQSEGTYQWIRCACPDRPLNVIFFTWPSEQERLLLAACELRRQGTQAETNAFYVTSLLAFIPDSHPVCLLGHSYGGRMAMAAMHLAGGGELQGCRLNRGIGAKRVRVILAAAALDHSWINDGGRYGCAACRSECVLNLRNRRDCVLKLYPLLRPLTSRRAIGASGVTFFDRQQQQCTCRIADFDVTGIVPGSHFWPAYYETPGLARMIAPWVYFPEVNPGYVLPQPMAEAASQNELNIETIDIESSDGSAARFANTAHVNVRQTTYEREQASNRQPSAQPRAVPAMRPAQSDGSRASSPSRTGLLQWFRDRRN